VEYRSGGVDADLTNRPVPCPIFVDWSGHGRAMGGDRHVHGARLTPCAAPGIAGSDLRSGRCRDLDHRQPNGN